VYLTLKLKIFKIKDQEIDPFNDSNFTNLSYLYKCYSSDAENVKTQVVIPSSITPLSLEIVLLQKEQNAELEGFKLNLEVKQY
jgi:hypothetical protein